MKMVNRIGLVLVFAAMFLALATLVSHAGELQCWPAHTPFRADAALTPDQASALFGLICAIGAVLFLL